MTEDINLSIPIGEVVRAWREAHEMTLGQLVEEAGSPITKQYISQLETQKIRNPGDEYLIRIAKALKIPVSYLVNRVMPEESINGKAQPAAEERKVETLPRTAYNTPLDILPAD